jgi:hypothetical protein
MAFVKRLIDSRPWSRRRLDTLRAAVIRAAAALARSQRPAAPSLPPAHDLLLPLTSGTAAERHGFQLILSSLFQVLVHLMAGARGLHPGPEGEPTFSTSGNLLFPEATQVDEAGRRALDELASLSFGKNGEPADFGTLPPDALGTLYESLLPYFPRILRTVAEPGDLADRCLTRMKDPARLERRKAGSFYTGRPLVDALLRSALAPSLAERFEREGLPGNRSCPGNGTLLDGAALSGQQRARAEEILLDFKVVDPACGSAAFLIAAQEVLARELAGIRFGAENPTQAGIREARKDVLLGTLHGVDRDPMALYLARIGLWLNTGDPELDLEALKSNLRCGDALLGSPVRNGPVDRKAADRWTSELLGPPQEEPQRFIHWSIAFAGVFSRKVAGFDCVLANPPWERIKLQEREFFAQQDPAIAAAGRASERQRLIRKLERENPELYRAYQARLEGSAALSRFLRSSGRYALSSCGDPNTYLFFIELCRDLLSPAGRAGLIVPSGFATDKGASPLFQDLMEKGSLVSLFDFVNRKRLFPGIAGPNRFCLLTIGGARRPARSAEFQFFCESPEDLDRAETRFCLDRRDLALLNPNTRTCPPFVHGSDADRVKAIYRRMPVLIREQGDEKTNPWEVRFWNMFHMSGDSRRFRTRRALEDRGGVMEGNRDFSMAGGRWLRLYESKLMHILDHRYNTFEGIPLSGRAGIKPGTRAVTAARAADPRFHVEPRYWVPEEEVARRSRAAGWTRAWFLGLRSVTNVFTNRRSVVPAILPWCGVGNSASLVSSPLPARRIAVLAACFSSMALDYVARMKIVGSNLNFFILKQLPVPEPAAFDRPFGNETVEDFITHRVVALCYTARDLESFAHDMGFDGPPTTWDETRRADIQAELDALFFMLYGLKRADLESIMSTFPILERKETARHGEFRSSRLVAEAWERLEPRFLRS